MSLGSLLFTASITITLTALSLLGLAAVGVVALSTACASCFWEDRD